MVEKDRRFLRSSGSTVAKKGHLLEKIGTMVPEKNDCLLGNADTMSRKNDQFQSDTPTEKFEQDLVDEGYVATVSNQDRVIPQMIVLVNLPLVFFHL